MQYLFDDYNSAHFLHEAQTVCLNEWNIEYLSFSGPDNRKKPPLVFIGGAFQNFQSFRQEVKRLLPEFPIIIINLPGQGTNSQLSEELSFADFSRLIKEFMDQVEIERIVPIGLSYGSAIAYNFAVLFPDRTEKLIIGGVAPSMRPGLQKKFEIALSYLASGDLEKFSKTSAHHLFNVSKKHLTGLSDRFIRGLYQSLLNLTPTEQLRYHHNTMRLFNARLEGVPSCEALVFTAEYDCFVTPFESYEVARMCPHYTFVMFENADHLLPIEKSRDVILLYRNFMLNLPVSDIASVKFIDTSEQRPMDKRMEPRWPVGEDVTISDVNGHFRRARLENINHDGCYLTLHENFPESYEIKGEHRLHVAGEFVLDMILLPAGRGYRGLFMKNDFAAFEELCSYIEKKSRIAVPLKAG